MKIHRILPIACASLASCVLIAQTPPAGSSPWQGAYRMDINRSNLAGDTITYTRSADGALHYNDGSRTLDFTPDGKPYPIHGPDLTQTVVMPDAHSIDIVIQFKGKTSVTIHETLSADGNLLTDATTSAATNATVTTISKRTAPGEGFLGTWTSTKVTSTAPGSALAINVTADGTFTWTWGQGPNQAALTGKPDGTPLRFAGEDPSRTLAFKMVSPSRLDFTNRSGDKITTIGYMQLSDDAKTLDDVYWDPTDPSTKGNKLYLRQ